MAANLVKMLAAVVEAVDAGGLMGAPGGTIYAAMMSHGATLETYERIMGSLVDAGFVVKRGDCYHTTSEGRAFASAHQ